MNAFELFQKLQKRRIMGVFSSLLMTAIWLGVIFSVWGTISPYLLILLFCVSFTLFIAAFI